MKLLLFVNLHTTNTLQRFGQPSSSWGCSATALPEIGPRQQGRAFWPSPSSTGARLVPGSVVYSCRPARRGSHKFGKVTPGFRMSNSADSREFERKGRALFNESIICYLSRDKARSCWWYFAITRDENWEKNVCNLLEYNKSQEKHDKTQTEWTQSSLSSTDNTVKWENEMWVLFWNVSFINNLIFIFYYNLRQKYG